MILEDEIQETSELDFYKKEVEALGECIGKKVSNIKSIKNMIYTTTLKYFTDMTLYKIGEIEPIYRRRHEILRELIKTAKPSLKEAIYKTVFEDALWFENRNYPEDKNCREENMRTAQCLKEAKVPILKSFIGCLSVVGYDDEYHKLRYMLEGGEKKQYYIAPAMLYVFRNKIEYFGPELYENEYANLKLVLEMMQVRKNVSLKPLKDVLVAAQSEELLDVAIEREFIKEEDIMDMIDIAKRYGKRKIITELLIRA